MIKLELHNTAMQPGNLLVEPEINPKLVSKAQVQALARGIVKIASTGFENFLGWGAIYNAWDAKSLEVGDVEHHVISVESIVGWYVRPAEEPVDEMVAGEAEAAEAAEEAE